MSIKKLCILLLLPLCAQAENAAPKPSASLPAAPLTIEEARAQQERAADMRREADRLRADTEATRERDDAACHPKILVNACREDVRKAYIQRITVVRQLEIDANHIDRVAKSRQLELESALKRAPAPTVAPMPAGSQPAGQPPKPGAKPLSSPGAVKTPPAATVTPATQARADAARNQRISEAERQKQARAAAAAERARKAREDAERYAQRAREHAEKKARKASASAPAGK